MHRAAICHHGSPVFLLPIFVWSLQLGLGTSVSLGNALMTGDSKVSLILHADVNIRMC